MVLRGVVKVLRADQGLRVFWPAVALCAVLCLILLVAPGTAAADSDPVATLSGSEGVSSAGGGSVSIDARGADIRDVLSALALKMGSNIIFASEPLKVSFQVDGASPRRALDILAQRHGLACIQDGNLIVVGKPDELDRNFFTQMHLTRFNLSYLPAEKVKSLISQLGIPAKVLTVETNQGLLWVQGTAQALQKTRELVNAVDVADVGGAVQLARKSVFVYQFDNITAKYAAERLESFVTDEADSAAAMASLISSLAGTAGTGGMPVPDTGSPSAAVKTITFNYPEFGRELLVICPSAIEADVRGALARLDDDRAKVRIPVAKGDDYQLIHNYRKLLVDLTGIPSSSFHISSDLMPGANKEYVMWVEESPDNVKRVADYLELIEGAQSVTVEEDDDSDD